MNPRTWVLKASTLPLDHRSRLIGYKETKIREYQKFYFHLGIDTAAPRYVCLPSILTYLLTYLLTPWSRVILEKITGSQIVKKFPAFYGTRRFVTAFTSARHLSQIDPVHAPISNFLKTRPIYVWVFQVVSFPQVSPTNPCIRLSSLPYVLHSSPLTFFSILSPEQYKVSSTYH